MMTVIGILNAKVFFGFDVYLIASALSDEDGIMEIPGTPQIVRALLIARIQSPISLTDADIKYIRKNMGMSVKDFAKDFNVDYVSNRWILGTSEFNFRLKLADKLKAFIKEKPYREGHFECKAEIIEQKGRRFWMITEKHDFSFKGYSEVTKYETVSEEVK